MNRLMLAVASGGLGTFLGWLLCVLWARRHRMTLSIGTGFPREVVYVVPSLASFLPRYTKFSWKIIKPQLH